jgi:TonB family protein
MRNSLFRRAWHPAAALCSISAARLFAQDVSISPPSWIVAHDAPGELPVLRMARAMEFPSELKKTPDIGYVVHDLMLDAKGKVLGLAPHGTLAAYERAAGGYSGEFSWSPGRRDGKGVTTESSFAVIFNPAAAAEKIPEAMPRLLEVGLVRLKRAKEDKTRAAVPDRVEMAEVSVDAAGNVTAVKNAPPGLEHAFTVAVKNWRFAPARRGGVPVAAEVRMPFVIVTDGSAGEFGDGKRTLPRATLQQPPRYPMAMRASGMRGEVLVDFLVDIEGRVRNPYVVRSLNPSFDEPAVDAVRQWRFEPGTVGGRPVTTHMQVPVVFTLNETADGGQGPLTEARKPDLSKLPEQFRYDTPPKPRGTVRVVYPYELLRAKKEGKASVVYVVGPEGRVIQADIRDGAVPEFGRAVRAAIECFTFEPAIKGGRPGPALQAFSQEFNRDDQWQLVSHEDLSLLRREEKNPATILSLGELDEAPKALSRRPPQFPLSVPNSTTYGETLIEFLIDEEGSARLPRVLSASDDAFGYAAVQAVATWRFEPPRRGGKTVVAHVQIPITFGETPAPAKK